MKFIVCAASVSLLAASLGACSKDSDKSPAPKSDASGLPADQKMDIYTQVHTVLYDTYLEQVAAIDGADVTNPMAIWKSAYLICSNMAAANGIADWVSFNEGFTRSSGLTTDQAAKIYGATVEAVCPNLKDHYYKEVLK